MRSFKEFIEAIAANSPEIRMSAIVPTKYKPLRSKYKGANPNDEAGKWLKNNAQFGGSFGRTTPPVSPVSSKPTTWKQRQQDRMRLQFKGERDALAADFKKNVQQAANNLYKKYDGLI